MDKVKVPKVDLILFYYFSYSVLHFFDHAEDLLNKATKRDFLILLDIRYMVNIVCTSFI